MSPAQRRGALNLQLPISGWGRARLRGSVFPLATDSVGHRPGDRRGRPPGQVAPLHAGKRDDGQHASWSHQGPQPAQRCGGIPQVMQRRVRHDGIEEAAFEVIGQHSP